MYAAILFAWAVLPMVPAFAQEEPDLTKLNDPALVVAGEKMLTVVPGVQVKQGTLVIPIRPVAERLLSDLDIDSFNQTITVIRADDRAELNYNGRTTILKLSSFNQGPQPNANLIDWTPGREAVPQALLERLFNVFVSVDTHQNEVAVVPNSATFGEALTSYHTEKAKQPAKEPFKLPAFKLNAVQYDSLINRNTVSFLGHTTSGRVNAQVGQTMINTYGQYLGSTFGPGWRYGMGGVNIIRPAFGQVQIGDYALRTGGLFASGLFRGLCAERAWGRSSKIGFQIGQLQNSTQYVGIQTQRPIFKRNDVLAYFSYDTRDFRHSSSLWKNHWFKIGAGTGGYRDQKNLPQPLSHAPGAPENPIQFTPGKAYLSYFYVRDEFDRFKGNLHATTNFDLGGSSAIFDTRNILEKFHTSSVFVFRNHTTLFKRITFSNLVQRGGPNWRTLDISNVYKNQFLMNEGVTLKLLQGVSTFASYQMTHPTAAGQQNNITKLYTAGISFHKWPNYLPEVSFSTNVTPVKGGASQFFNTLVFNQNILPLRTTLNGQWFYANNGENNTPNQIMMMTSRTALWRGVASTAMMQWSTPSTTNWLIGAETGNLFGTWFKGTFSIGELKAPDQIQHNVNAGLSVFIPYINQKADVNFSRSNNFVQVMVNLSGFVGRGQTPLSQYGQPQIPIRPMGTVIGRFYIDNDLSGTFDPAIDKPLPNMRVIASGAVMGRTDSEGKYTVKGLPKGFLSFTTDLDAVPANLAFLNNTSQDTFILPGKTKVIDFRFGKFGHMAGRVKADGPVPKGALRDIRIYVAGTDRDSLTDEEGRFIINDISPGKYVVRMDPDYVAPELEIVEGEAQVTVKPGTKVSDISFLVRERPKQIEEKRF